MTALEEIKKALKKVAIGEWYISYVKNNGLSVVENSSDSRMFGIAAETFEAEYIAAVNPAAISEILSTLESLQRENAALKIDASNHAADAENARRYRDDERRRAEAAETEVKRYRVALIAAKTRMRNCRGAIESDQVIDKDVHGSLQNGIRDIQDALASTGGEHNADK